MSATPNSPMTTATRSSPLSRSAWPKVKRGIPAVGSIPTTPSISPNTAMMRAMTTDRPASAMTNESPNAMRANCSTGPNLRAISTIGGAATTRPTVAMVPPMNEPMAAMLRATPARPCFAIGKPSKQVTTVEASPGMFISTLVMVPPYWEP
jgi:hypothetical protein